MYIVHVAKFLYNVSPRITLVVGFSFFLFSGTASAATLSVNANTATLSLGETTTLRVLVNTAGVAVNNTEAKLSFPSDLIEVVSINKDNSIMTLWVEDPSFSNSAGVITFNGGVPTPGYTGTQGQILSVVVKAKKAGRAEFVFSNTAVRANDGLGTNVLTSQAGVVLMLIEAAVTPIPVDTSVGGVGLEIHSTTHPDQTKWYTNNTPKFSWSLPKGALEVRMLIGENPSATPSVSYVPAISEKKVGELPDGTYHFSLQMRTAYGWGAVSRYHVNIDTTPPKPFLITFPLGNTEWEPQPIVSFMTTDNGSGVSHYEIKIGEGGESIRVTPSMANSFTLPSQYPGTYTLFVTAVDGAGNVRTSSTEFTVEAIDTPVITYYPETLEEEEVLKVRGTTYPNAKVTVYIREGDTLVAEEYTRSNTLGDFTLVTDAKLSGGIYTITARVEDKRGAQSHETTPLTVVVRSEFVVGIINFVLKYLSAAILILLALGGIVWISAHLWFKLPRKIALMRREARGAEVASARAFKVLRESIRRHINRLEKTNRKLTKGELGFLEEFEDKLGQAEEILGKEIKDISKS